MGIGRPNSNSSFIHFTEDKEVLSKLDLTLVCCACVWRGGGRGVWRLGPGWRDLDSGQTLGNVVMYVSTLAQTPRSY